MVEQLYYPKSDCRRMEGKFPYEPRDISEIICDDLRPCLEGQATLKDANAIIGRKASCCHSLLSCR